MSSKIKNFPILFLLFFTLNDLFAGVQFSNVEATLARGGAGGKISISFSLQGITKLVGTGGDAAGVTKYSHRLKIYMIDRDSSIPLAIEELGTDISKAFVYSIPSIGSEEVTERTAGVSWDVAIAFEIEAQSESIIVEDLARPGNLNKINIKIQYTGPDDTSQPSTTVVAQVENRVPLTSPDQQEPENHFGASELNWKQKTVRFSNGDSNDEVKARGFAIPADQGEVTVTGLVFDETADVDTVTRDCVINTDAADGSECFSCTPGSGGTTELIHLELSSLPKDLVTGVSSSTSATSVTVSGLAHDENAEEGPEYVAFLAYDPDGTGFSSCKRIKSVRNYSFLERLDSEADSKWTSGSACVIATAAYGTPWAKELQILRHFRDTYLMNSEWGQYAVAKYYRYGPKVVPYIENSPFLKWMIRMTLTPVTLIISFLK